MPNLILTTNLNTSRASRRMLDSVEHLVVPVVAIREGVLNGTFYSRAEIEAYHQTWNGVPVPVDHPVISGHPVSANMPEFEGTVNIGRLFNINYADGSLMGEIWINIEKATRLGFASIIASFDAGEIMEVSTGLFSEITERAGVFNNEPYINEATHIRPDHVALLPYDIGACSIEDGCGAGSNKILAAVKALGKRLGVVDNNSPDAPVVTPITTHEEANMPTPLPTVDEIIAHQSNQFTEEHRAHLTNLPQAMLAAMIPVDSATPITNTATPIADSAVPITDPAMPITDPAMPIAAVTAELVANGLTDADRKLFDQLKANEAQRVDAIRKVVNDGYTHLTPAVTANMDLATLNALAAGLTTSADYSAAGGSADPANPEKVRTHISVLLAKPTPTPTIEEAQHA